MLCVPYGFGYVPNEPSFRTSLKWFIERATLYHKKFGRNVIYLLAR